METNVSWKVNQPLKSPSNSGRVMVGSFTFESGDGVEALVVGVESVDVDGGGQIPELWSASQLSHESIALRFSHDSPDLPARIPPLRHSHSVQALRIRFVLAQKSPSAFLIFLIATELRGHVGLDHTSAESPQCASVLPLCFSV